MRYFGGLIMAGALLAGSASTAQAQFSMYVGSPFGGTQVAVGTPYSYNMYGGYGYSPYGGAYGYSPYSSTGYYGYSPYATTFASPYSYSSGYAGYVAPSTVITTPGLGYGYSYPYSYSSSYYYGYPRRFGLGLGMFSPWRRLGMW